MERDMLTPSWARGIAEQALAAIEVPSWLERYMAETGLAEPWREHVRRLYRASQFRIRERMRLTGAKSLEELLAMDEARQREEALREAGIPPKLLEESAGNPRMTEALAWAQVMDEAGVGQGQCLVLAGPTGVGKSTAMAWLARRCAEKGRRPRWEYAPEMFARLSMADIQYHPITVADVLLIDDLGAEDDHKARAKLDTLVYYRHAARRPTVITTNLTAKALADRYGERIVDRLQEWGPVIQIVAESMRLPAEEGAA